MEKLTPADLRILGEHLQQRATELKQVIRNEVAHTAGEDDAEHAGAVTDVGDDATADLLNDTDHVMHSQHLAEWAAITAAQARLAAGEYGLCSHCGEAIDVRRLRVNPAAARCVRCQALEEHASGAARPNTL